MFLQTADTLKFIPAHSDASRAPHPSESADDVNMATDWSPILVAIFEPGCDAGFFFFKRHVGTSSSRVRAHFVRNCVLENNQVVSASFDKLFKNDCDWFAVDFGACMSPTSNKLSCDQELDYELCSRLLL